MSGVDETLEAVRTAVRVVRREGQYAVVTPTAVTGKLADRHHLDERDAEVDKVVEMLDRARERACCGEGADVQFVDHGTRQRAPVPSLVGP